MKRIKVRTVYDNKLMVERWDDLDDLPTMMRNLLGKTTGMSRSSAPVKVVLHYEGSSGDDVVTYEWAEYLPEPFPVGGPEPEVEL